MKVTEQDLREHYETLDTKELLELQAQGTLTEMATRVLEQMLGERAVSAEERAAVAAKLEEEAKARDGAMGSLASVSARVVTQVIDTGVMLLIVMIALLLGVVFQPLIVLGIPAALAYLLFADGFPHGQSLGKRAVKIAVIDRRTHEPCTYAQSFVRNFLLALLGIIDWIFIFGRTHQRLGDRAADTLVVNLKGS